MTWRVCRIAGMVVAGVVGTALSGAAQCEPDGSVQFVCGPVSPEDLARVPDTPWVIVASWEDDGYLSAASAADFGTVRLYPTAGAGERLDATTYAGCPGPSADAFRAHGISLRPGADDVHTLYVVRHGAREAIEVFDLDARGATPALTWIGCAVAPEGLGLNAVVALPGGGIGVTSPRTSDIWEWHSDGGWSKVPGSEAIGPNGIEVSPDGEWFYVAGYAAQSVLRLSRGRTPIEKDTIANVGFNIDNIHWAPDGTILAAGHSAPTRARVGECIQRITCEGLVSHVAKVDPATGDSQEVFTYATSDYLRLGTVAIQVDDELWVGSVAGSERIARVTAP